MVIGRTVWGPKVPTLKGTEASLSYVQCFLYLVPSSVNVSIFHITWLDTSGQTSIKGKIVNMWFQLMDLITFQNLELLCFWSRTLPAIMQENHVFLTEHGRGGNRKIRQKYAKKSNKRKILLFVAKQVKADSRIVNVHVDQILLLFLNSCHRHDFEICLIIHVWSVESLGHILVRL